MDVSVLYVFALWCLHLFLCYNGFFLQWVTSSVSQLALLIACNFTESCVFCIIFISNVLLQTNRTACVNDTNSQSSKS